MLELTVKLLEQGLMHSILVVEDSLPDYTAISRAFKKLNMANPVYRCESGEEALNFLYQRKNFNDPLKAPRPSLILLDLNLPGTDGRAVLKQIKSDPELKSIPVIILTTSDLDRDVDECYRNGANSYVTKPVEWDKLFEAINNFKTFWLQTAILPDGLATPRPI